MKKLWEKFKGTFLTKSFILFAFIGVVNTLNNFLLSSLCASFLQPNLAFTVGYFGSLTIGYFLNTWLTFRQRPEFIKYLKYCVSYIPNFLIQQGVVFVVYNLLGWDKLIAYALAAIIGVPVTFILLKVFAFARRDKKTDDAQAADVPEVKATAESAEVASEAAEATADTVTDTAETKSAGKPE